MPQRIEDLDANMKAAHADEDGLCWISYRDDCFTVNGLGWYEENDRALIRLPRSVEGVVRDPVWQLAQSPSGARIRFQTDATKMALRIRQDEVVMTNMSPIGHSGIDVYTGAPNAQQIWATTKPDLEAMKAGRAYTAKIHENQSRVMREYTVYLPVYNALLDLEIGVDAQATFAPASSYGGEKPLVFYGTSITQGGCSSRPGTGYVPILSRMLNRDVINLGFSGNGMGEPELAELVAQLDAEVFILDYEANAGYGRMQENLEPFCRTIRERHPQAPLVLLTKICFTQTRHDPVEAAAGRARVNALFRRVVATMNRDYPGATVMVDGWTLIGPETPHAYCDGVHPGDAGFAQMAERLAPVLQSFLQLEGE